MNDYIESEYDKKVFEFIHDVIYGIETKIYYMTSEDNGNKNKDLSTEIQDPIKYQLEDLKTQRGMYCGMNLLEYYLNNLYKSLVEKSDDLVLNTFSELGKLIDLHPVYTLNIITNVIMKVYPLYPRSKLIIDSKEKYLESVKSNVNLMRKYILTMFNDDLKNLRSQKKINPDSD